MEVNSSKNNRHPFEWAYETLKNNDLDKFIEKAKRLAEINEVTFEEFQEYVDWCFENPRSIDDIKADNERYGHKKKSIDIWREEVQCASNRRRD